jgi:acyl-CoA synthetase (AMP-forming)/AMP-acid ligase II
MSGRGDTVEVRMTALATTDLVCAHLRRRWAEAGIYPDRDVYRLFSDHVRAQPERAAVIDDEGEFSYAAIDDLARRLAAGLATLDVRPGEVVATQLPNGWLACVAELAIAALGAVALPFPVGRGPREAAILLRRTHAVAAIAATTAGEHRPAAQLAALRDDLPRLRTVVAAGPGHPPAACVPLGRLLESRPRDRDADRSDPDGPARILVSSGSEADPKMVVYSHNALTGGRGGFLARIMPAGQPLRVLFLPPQATAYGAHAVPVALARHGGTLILQSRFDPAGALTLIDRAHPSHIFGVPTMFRMLREHPALAATDTASLRALVFGGSRLDLTTAQACRRAFGCAVVNLYGSADGMNCHTTLDDPPSRAGTVGRPNPAVAEIRIVDDELNPLPRGRVGEVIARGPITPMRYLDDNLNARYRTPDGWVRSGDLGVLDDEGYLTIVGRRKDVIIRGGTNISPAEVEHALASHPAVRDVACVGVPDALMGERLCACVVPTLRHTVGLDELAAQIRGLGLERYKQPERLLMLDALPLSPAGKVDKDRLRELVAHAEAA